MTTTDQSNNTSSEKRFPTPAALDAVRLEMRAVKTSRDADKAQGVLFEICNNWQKNGYLCNANMYTKDGHDVAVLNIVRTRLRDFGWNEDTHYTLSRMSDDRGYTITFKSEYTSFKP